MSRLAVAAVTLLMVPAPLVATAGPATPTEAATNGYAYKVSRYVKRVLDGDTIEVYRSGTSGSIDTIRFAGINTNEVPYMCHGEAAKQRLKNKIEGKWVTLKADHSSSRASDGVRHLRFVEYKGRDMGRLMIDEAYAIPLPSNREPSRNVEYLTAARAAAEKGIRIWDEDACGPGPHAGAKLRMVVHWDAEGADGTPSTLNDEWVRIFNDGGSAVSVAGWRLKDSSTANIWYFPAGASIGAGGYITIYVGSGQNTSTKFYMGYNQALFGNLEGDSGLLLDPDDDIRAYFVYPCVKDCFDPLQGRIRLSANPDAAGDDIANPNGEWINISNISDQSFNLRGYVLRSGGKLYEFPDNSRVDPGERMRVYVGSGSSSRLENHWGQSRGILANAGDSVQIETYDEVTVASFEWPCSPCGPVADVRITDYRWDVPGGDDGPNSEWIEITNHSEHPVDLRDWQLSDNVNRLDFEDGRILGAGKTLRVYIGSGSDTSSKMFWGLSGQILFSNDMIQLHTPHRDLASCKDWGTLNCAPRVPPTMCKGHLATVVGTGGADELYGTGSRDVIMARGGKDTITPNGGNDIICGGGGKDTISFRTAGNGVTVDLNAGTASGQGSDVLASIERIIGSQYADTLDGNSKKNRIDGRGGADLIEGFGGDDKLRGRGGADTIFGHAGDDFLHGGKGNDTLNGGIDRDECHGGHTIQCEL